MLFTHSPFRNALYGITVLVFSVLGTAYAQNESRSYDPFSQAAIMHVGFINPDCVRDTVYGFLDHDLRWTPRFICFGNTVDAEGNLLCEQEQQGNAQNAARNDHARRNDTTFFDFPGWTRFSCVLSVQRYNANDTLDDLIFWMRGTDSIPRRGLVDTARSIVLFGQRDLEKRKRVDLADIGEFRSEPFYAMELTKGRELINAKKRDLTRRKSRELVRVDKEVLEKKQQQGKDSTVAEPQRDLAAGDAAQRPVSPESVVPGDPVFSVRIYPNPAIYTTNVEIAPLPPGSYSVEVVAVNGEEVWRGDARLEQTGQVLQTVDLGDLAAGYYVLRIHTAEKIIGTYPIVVIR